MASRRTHAQLWFEQFGGHSQGRGFRPGNPDRLGSRVQDMGGSVSARALPWVFPKEVQALRDFLPQALLDP